MNNNLIGEQITKFRKAAGLTQEDLGRAVGVSTQAVSRWECGGAPDVSLLPAIADQLGVTIDALFGREGGVVEDINGTVKHWLLSLPEEQRMKQLSHLTWMSCQYVIHRHLENLGGPELAYCDSCKVEVAGEEILVRMAVEVDEGLLFGVGAEDFSFMSVWPRPEEGYAAYFAPRDVCRKCFALLAQPGCLELLERLHDDPQSRYYIPQVLARDLDLTAETVAHLLAALEELGMVKKLNLELETGMVSAYIVHENWAFTPFMLFTRCLLEKRDAFFLLWDDFAELDESALDARLHGRLTVKRPDPSAPGQHPVKGEKNMKNDPKTGSAARDYYRAFYQGNRLRFALAIALTFLAFPSNLVGSWILGEIIDVIAAGDLAWLGRTLIFTAVFVAAMFCIQTAMYRAKSGFIYRALAQYKSLAFQNLSAKSISAFAQENTGRYISILTNDVSSIETNYLKNSFVLIYHVLLFFGALSMMFWYSPLLALATIVLSLLPLAASLLMGKELVVREKTVSDKNEGFVSQLKDLLSGFSVIKSFKAERETQRIFDTTNQEVEEHKRRRYWWECLLTDVQGSCANILQFGIFFLGAFLAIRGDITAGTVLIFVNLCNFVIQPINIVPQYWASRKAAAGLIEKLAEVTEENAGRSGDPIEPVLRDAIALDHVTFGYEPDQPVLKDLSLRLEAGKKYALVGASGSGKSTLLNLLMGSHDTYGGSIAIDGKELREVDTDSLYDLMSLIGQNVFLFDDTIRRNITMFRDFPEERIDTAVRRSGLDALLAQRGEDYRCGENGVGLSGGERQRVSIARCLLRGTPVLLLDEATAALDNQTAFAVTDAILHLDGLTRLVVTHRLDEALLEQYDEIIVLRGGEVCERGTYRDLMAEKAYFYSLYNVTNG